MHILIKKATLVDPSHKLHLQQVDILVVDGFIKEISPSIKNNSAEIWEGNNLHVSPGWFDMRANFKDPGTEYMEDIYSGANAAMYGGFTGVCITPDTTPAIDNKSQVMYLKDKAKSLLIDVHVNGALSKNLEGKELAEMYDMHLAGAKGFYNGKHNEVSSALMQKSLLYAKQMNEVVINFPLDRSISGKAQIHEGKISTSLGMKGIPSIAEEIRLNRDLYLATYTESRYHAATVSTKGSVDLIEQFKSTGTKVTSDVAAFQLLFTDDNLSEFDTSLKQMPPYREENDRLALVKGLKNHTIDVICSDHEPWDEDHKKVEFDFAEYGAVALESAFSVANTVLKDQLNITEIVSKMCQNPREILGLDTVRLAEGLPANLTVFDPTLEYTFSTSDIQSKCTNSPVLNQLLTGKALGVINKSQKKWWAV